MEWMVGVFVGILPRICMFISNLGKIRSVYIGRMKCGIDGFYAQDSTKMQESGGKFMLAVRHLGKAW